MSGCSPAEPGSVSSSKTIIARGEKNYGRGGYIGSSSLEEEALATQGQPELPCGLADFASAALIKAACVRETVEQNTRCQDLDPGRPLIQRTESRRDGYGVQPQLKRTARQPRKSDRDNLLLRRPTPYEHEKINKNEVRHDFQIDAMRPIRHLSKKTPDSTLDSKCSFREG